MAVDGRKFGDTFSVGSEKRNIEQCRPCSKDGNTVEAIKYCMECNENLCLTCVSHHNKFSMMKGHQIQDKQSCQTGKTIPDLPTQRCNNHGGKLIDLYCSYHDSVGCSECLEIYHSTCKGIKNVSDMASGIQTQNEISDLNTKLMDLLTRLDQLKEKKQGRLKHLRQEQEKLLKEIRVLRKKINDHLDKMEEILVNQVLSKYGFNIQSTKKDLSSIIDIKSSVENCQKNITEDRSVNEAELFVQLKIENSKLQESEDMLQRIDTPDGEHTMKLLPGKYIQMLLEHHDDSFGQISEILVVKSTKHVFDSNVRLQSDAMTCRILDACLTTSGMIVVSDFQNMCIKKLDNSYAMIDHLSMPDNPSRLCEVDNTLLAVTLVNDKKIQFVSQYPFALGNSFYVSDGCRGIDCHNGQLYVCCGGSTENGENPGCIEVYNTEGMFLRSLGIGQNSPICIKVLDRDKMLISDYFENNPFTLIASSYSILSEMPIKKLCNPTGSCKIGVQLCIAGCSSNNIVLISEDVDQQQELLTETDGIVEPWAVCFDKEKSRLIVSFENSDIIKVFDISF